MRDIIRPGLVLFLITFIAAVCLGAANAITEEPIARQNEKIKNEAMAEILSSASEFKEDVAIPEGSKIEAISTGYSSGGNIEGYIIEVKNKGFGGAMTTLVAINTSGSVSGIKIVNHSETPGLGANAVYPSFTDQYKNLSGEIKVTKLAPGDNEVQAITSSTITTNAVTLGVNNALAFFRENLGGAN